MEHLKLCGRCKNDKPIAEYYKNKCKPDGHSAICKVCDKQSEQAKRLNNLDKYRKRKANYASKRRKSDINFKLAHNLRNRVKRAVKYDQKGGSAVIALGCSIQELRNHLESLFKTGMNWDNYGYGEHKWNIDHIMPLSRFDLKNPEKLNIACHYSNLQPLWTFDNIRKSNR